MPSRQQWLDFGRDLCQLAGDVAQSATAAAIGTAVVVPATVVAGVRDLPRAAGQIWGEALSTPSDSVADFLLKGTGAAAMMVPLAMTPLAYGLVGLVVGSWGCALEARENGLGSALDAACKIAEEAPESIRRMDYRA